MFNCFILQLLDITVTAHMHTTNRDKQQQQKCCILNQFYLYYDKLFCKTNPANKLSYFLVRSVTFALEFVCCLQKKKRRKRANKRDTRWRLCSWWAKGRLYLWQCAWMDECTSMATNKTKRKYSIRNGAQPARWTNNRTKRTKSCCKFL